MCIPQQLRDTICDIVGILIQQLFEQKDGNVLQVINLLELLKYLHSKLIKIEENNESEESILDDLFIKQDNFFESMQQYFMFN